MEGHTRVADYPYELDDLDSALTRDVPLHDVLDGGECERNPTSPGDEDSSGEARHDDMAGTACKKSGEIRDRLRGELNTPNNLPYGPSTTTFISLPNPSPPYPLVLATS